MRAATSADGPLPTFYARAGLSAFEIEQTRSQTEPGDAFVA
jgi:hypothetical protein